MPVHCRPHVAGPAPDFREHFSVATASVLTANDYVIRDISLAAFGRKEEEFSWERTDKASTLASELKSTRAA